MGDTLRYDFTFSIVPDLLVEDEGTNIRHIAVYATIGKFADKHGAAWPGMTVLKNLLRCSKPTLIKTIKELEDMGWVVVHRHYNKDTKLNEVNHYTLCCARSGSKGALPPIVKEIDQGSKGALPKPDAVNKNHITKKEHPILKVPINTTRYNNLCERHGKKVVDDAIESYIAWEDSHGRAPSKDYAASAFNWLKKKEEFNPSPTSRYCQNVRSDDPRRPGHKFVCGLTLQGGKCPECDR